MKLDELFEAASPYVNTENFKNWFNGSKVVDKNGKPLAVFHGTMEEFDEFKLESEKRRAYGINRLGFWFDEDSDTPNYFALGFDPTKPIEPKYQSNVIVAYLSIKNPLVIKSQPILKSDQNKLDSLLKKRDLIAYREFKANLEKRDSYTTLIHSVPKPSDVTFGSPRWGKAVDQYKEELISQGYDGIKLINTNADSNTRGEKLTDWWIAFFPNQIKSVTNSGTFDNSNNIIN